MAGIGWGIKGVDEKPLAFLTVALAWLLSNTVKFVFNFSHHLKRQNGSFESVGLSRLLVTLECMNTIGQELVFSGNKTLCNILFFPQWCLLSCLPLFAAWLSLFLCGPDWVGP